MAKKTVKYVVMKFNQRTRKYDILKSRHYTLKAANRACSQDCKITQIAPDYY